jgi:penicillin-binding protein 2
MATRDSGETQSQLLPNPPTGPSLIQKPSDWSVINEGLRAVITGGTGKGLNNGFPYLISGKSGTAERYSRTSNAYDTNKNTAYLAARHRAWFVAYTPADDPQIAVAVLLEAGAWGGQDAGPIVRKILDAWLSTQSNAPPDTPLPEHARIGPGATTGTPATTAPANDASSNEDLPADASSSGEMQ